MGAYDWQGHALSVGQRVTVCAATVDGFPHGEVVEVCGGHVQVLMDNWSYPMWFRGEQLVIDSEVEEA